MALHNTQCPHCFTTYVISDDQLRVSEGMVRCGTCRERFQARILKKNTEVPRYDPREAFIEPLTEELDTQSRPATKTDAETEPQEFSFADPHTESIKSISLSDATVSGNINSEMSLDIDHDAPVTPLDAKQLSAAKMLANIRAKQARFEQLRKMKKATTEGGPSEIATDAVNPQAELALPPSERGDVEPRRQLKTSESHNKSKTETGNKESLIDQVDSLVDNKLANNKRVNALADGVAIKKVGQNNASKINSPFQLDRKPKVRSYAWLLAPPLLIIIAALTATLLYQLWIKQLVIFKNDSFIQKNIAKLSVPVTKKLAEYEVFLPVRRNLSRLELASAHTEAHPTRSSTTLLRISIINHAEIEQPLPWIEVSLTDAEGHLVSRRKLSPNDYVYQNATNNLIGARELKKVTIELLSFPKQATGYEVKMLSKWNLNGETKLLKKVAVLVNSIFTASDTLAYYLSSSFWIFIETLVTLSLCRLDPTN